VSASLLRERRVHRLYLFVAPTTFGLDGVRAFPDDAEGLVWDDFALAGRPERFGRDAMLVFDRSEDA